MVSRALLLGTGRSPKRALGAVAAAFVAASLVVALPWEPIRTAGRYPIWAALVAVGLGGPRTPVGTAAASSRWARAPSY